MAKGFIKDALRAELAKGSPEKKQAVKAYLDSKGYNPSVFGIDPKELG